MGMMGTAKFQEIIDGISDVFITLRAQRTALNGAMLTLFNSYAFYTDGISATDDADIELPMGQSAFDVDDLLENGVAESDMFTLYPSLRTFIDAFETHLLRVKDENFTDATIDGYLIYNSLTADALLVTVDDIWKTLKNQRLQARTVGKTSQVTLFTQTGTFSNGSTTWTGVAGSKLYAESYYNPYMESKWENFKAMPLTITKDKAGNLTLTSLKVTGLDENGILREVDFGSVSLTGTNPLALDVSKLFVDITSVTITATLAETTIFTFKNVASV